MPRYILILIAVMLCAMGVSAQYYTNQNKVWAFGFGGGLDFNSGVPVPFVSSLATNEGTASVADSAGGLLFYTNGSKVYDRTGALMPNGSGIAPYNTASTTQGVVIVPVIDSPGKYYIFSLEEAGFSMLIYSRLSWSKVDMSLHGGFGDVVPGEQGIIIDSGNSEKMTVVQGGSCNVWVLVHRRLSMQFLSFNISASGIGAPVTSTVGPSDSSYVNSYGVLMASPNGHKLATCASDIPHGLELFDFNPISGLVSGRQVLDSVYGYYGCEFSPDNTKLYALYDMGGSYGSRIDQYDISLPTQADIIASRATITEGGIGVLSQLKLGPDGKIYLNRFSDVSSSYMDVINFPNLAGGACGYVPHAVPLATGTHGFLGLNNVYMMPGLGEPTAFYSFDTFACISPGDTIDIYPHHNAAQYAWYDGNTDVYHVANGYGTYWVKTGNGCLNTVIDTIHVQPKYDSIYTHSDTIACAHSEIDSCTLIAPPGAYYQWYDGSTDSVNTVHHNGAYRVIYTVGCIRTFDTIHVNFQYYLPAITGPDSICSGHIALLENVMPGGVWASSAPAIAAIDIADNGLVDGIAGGTATISYAYPNYCSATKKLTVLPQPCVDEVPETAATNADISLYPNPAGDECTVSYTGGSYQGATVSILDLSGRVLHTYPLTGAHTVIPVAWLPQGLYQCKVLVNGSAQVCKKLVVMR